MKSIGKLFFLVFVLALITIPARAQGYDPTWQSPALWSNEAQVVYLGNLEREKAGLPPLRWNKQLTYAARWFSWDTTENNPNKCTHQDTLDRGPWQRTLYYGYLGGPGAENAYCGYVTPEFAINGWLHSTDHRKNLLDPNAREIGVGYYGSPNSAGYVTQDFGSDTAYAPVVINNEAPETTNRQVDLYVYDGESDGWDGSAGSAQEMLVSNDMCFVGADWQPYQPKLQWTLAGGDPGWRTVYVRTRDANHRTRSASDAIYYGTPPAEARTDEVQFSSTEEQVTLLGLDGGGLPLMQFSLGWQADDTVPTFQMKNGKSERVQDVDAWGGTAYKLTQNGTGMWVWTTDFLRDMPMVAYARLKVDDNRDTGEVLSLYFSDSNTTVSIRGTDFREAGVYQDFAIPFTFPTGQVFLILNFDTHSDEDVYVDTVTFFTEPIPVQETYTWNVPGGNYRGQGVWVRYVNESLDTFSEIQDGAQFNPRVSVIPDTLHTVAMLDVGNYIWQLKVLQVCSAATWDVSTDAAWLNLVREGDYLRITISPEALGLGSHKATITITPTNDSIAPVQVPIQVEVVEHHQQTFFPLLLR